jgi:ADP-ribosyl-[dinitrogen reductase] hydrolase
MKGSCLCGAIEYEIDSIDMPVVHCHCRTCQKAHAAPFASTAGVMHENFRWLKGEDKLSAFESSPGKLRHFCSVCGSHLVAERDNQPHVIVRIATLDENPNMTPQMHIWTSHDVSWLGYEGIPAYPEWQPGR